MKYIVTKDNRVVDVTGGTIATCYTREDAWTICNALNNIRQLKTNKQISKNDLLYFIKALPETNENFDNVCTYQKHVSSKFYKGDGSIQFINFTWDKDLEDWILNY